MEKDGNGKGLSTTIPLEKMAPGGPQGAWMKRTPTGSGRLLVDPGKEARELLMRTVFEDYNMAIDFVQFRQWCVDFGVTEELAQDIAASLCSIGGRGRFEYAMVETGIMVKNKFHGSLETTKKRGKKDKNADHDED